MTYHVAQSKSNTIKTQLMTYEDAQLPYSVTSDVPES
ncbi:hypothetical protein T01_4024 [Trichinella spiralis]|uniref:Uncharacterized protein n=1 Tax=Trichinella spiralis TaxID=6334 RepID=A0A0V0YS60_TRISP|nr:hypothetical protein T01_4024 [Trichinella spiralis]